MTTANQSELAQKMDKIISLSEAIDRAQKVLAEAKTPAAAQALQALVNQRRELRALLPRPRLIVDNT